jgi:hypothetical protein
MTRYPARSGLRAALACACGLGAAPPALGADWLAGPSRALPLSDTAAPDAAVTGLGFGPRARVSLGVDSSLLTLRGRGSDLRFGVTGLAVLEDATGRAVLPSQTLRTGFELGAAWAFPGHAPGARPSPRTLELGVVAGHRGAQPIAEYRLPDRYHADDVPFGAGGSYLGFDAAVALPWLPRLTVTSRLGLRLFASAFADAVGQPEASDVFADFTREGAEVETRFGLDFRWAASPSVAPVLSLYADGIAPHDDSAKKLWLGRALVGLALPGRAFELLPFLDTEAGHGQGLMVNRSELRLGAGVRIHGL